MKRNSLPNDKPAVEKTINIELPSGRLKLRLALVIALIVLAVAAFALGINSALSTEPGLTEISALSGEMNAGSSFTFYYYLGWDGADASDERRAVRSVYTEAATAALGLFDSGIDAGDVNGLYYLNRHANEPVAVDAALYSALEQLEESGTRYHYLAPLYAQYAALTGSTSDEEAAQYDPRLDAGQAGFSSAVAAYASDPGAVDIELLGGGEVRLNVSEEYLAFAAENGVTDFVGLGWMRNSFIADYIAAALTDAGYTRGALISVDGFMRCLDTETGTEYSFNFSHRAGGTVTNIAALHFSGDVSIACLRDYPAEGSAAGGYYQYADGRLRSGFLDPADGLDRCCVPELCGYSSSTGCAGLALSLAPLFIADTLDIDELETLEIAGISVYYTDNGALCSTADA